MASFDEVILPGQAGKVTAAVRTEGLAGAVSKVVTVTTDDPGRPTFSLTLRATIVASVDFFPSKMLFVAAGSPEGEPGRLLVRKSASEHGNLAISELASNAAWLKVSARKVEAPEPADGGLPPAMAADWVIEAKVDGKPPSARGTAVVKFKTGLQREPEVSFPVTLSVLPPLTFSTAMLYIPNPAVPGEPGRGTAFIQVRPGLDASGLTVETTPSAFGAVLERMGPHRYRVGVTWTPADAAAPREGALIAKLGAVSVSMGVRVNSQPAPVSGPAAAPAVPPTELTPLEGH